MQIKTQEQMSIRLNHQIMDLSVHICLNQRLGCPVQCEEFIITETDVKYGNGCNVCF